MEADTKVPLNEDDVPRLPTVHEKMEEILSPMDQVVLAGFPQEEVVDARLLQMERFLAECGPEALAPFRQQCEELMLYDQRDFCGTSSTSSTLGRGDGEDEEGRGDVDPNIKDVLGLLVKGDSALVGKCADIRGVSKRQLRGLYEEAEDQKKENSEKKKHSTTLMPLQNQDKSVLSTGCKGDQEYKVWEQGDQTLVQIEKRKAARKHRLQELEAEARKLGRSFDRTLAIKQIDEEEKNDKNFGASWRHDKTVKVVEMTRGQMKMTMLAEGVIEKHNLKAAKELPRHLAAEHVLEELEKEELEKEMQMQNKDMQLEEDHMDAVEGGGASGVEQVAKGRRGSTSSNKKRMSCFESSLILNVTTAAKQNRVVKTEQGNAVVGVKEETTSAGKIVDSDIASASKNMMNSMISTTKEKDQNVAEDESAVAKKTSTTVKAEQVDVEMTDVHQTFTENNKNKDQQEPHVHVPDKNIQASALLSERQVVAAESTTEQQVISTKKLTMQASTTLQRPEGLDIDELLPELSPKVADGFDDDLLLDPALSPQMAEKKAKKAASVTFAKAAGGEPDVADDPHLRGPGEHDNTKLPVLLGGPSPAPNTSRGQDGSPRPVVARMGDLGFADSIVQAAENKTSKTLVEHVDPEVLRKKKLQSLNHRAFELLQKMNDSHENFEIKLKRKAVRNVLMEFNSELRQDYNTLLLAQISDRICEKYPLPEDWDFKHPTREEREARLATCQHCPDGANMQLIPKDAPEGRASKTKKTKRVVKSQFPLLDARKAQSTAPWVSDKQRRDFVWARLRGMFMESQWKNKNFLMERSRIRKRRQEIQEQEPLVNHCALALVQDVRPIGDWMPASADDFFPLVHKEYERLKAAQNDVESGGVNYKRRQEEMNERWQMEKLRLEFERFEANLDDGIEAHDELTRIFCTAAETVRDAFESSLIRVEEEVEQNQSVVVKSEPGFGITSAEDGAAATNKKRPRGSTKKVKQEPGAEDKSTPTPTPSATTTHTTCVTTTKFQLSPEAQSQVDDLEQFLQKFTVRMNLPAHDLLLAYSRVAEYCHFKLYHHIDDEEILNGGPGVKEKKAIQDMVIHRTKTFLLRILHKVGPKNSVLRSGRDAAIPQPSKPLIPTAAACWAQSSATQPSPKINYDAIRFIELPSPLCDKRPWRQDKLPEGLIAQIGAKWRPVLKVPKFQDKFDEIFLKNVHHSHTLPTLLGSDNWRRFLRHRLPRLKAKFGMPPIIVGGIPAYGTDNVRGIGTLVELDKENDDDDEEQLPFELNGGTKIGTSNISVGQNGPGSTEEREIPENELDPYAAAAAGTSTSLKRPMWNTSDSGMVRKNNRGVPLPVPIHIPGMPSPDDGEEEIEAEPGAERAAAVNAKAKAKAAAAKAKATAGGKLAVGKATAKAKSAKFGAASAEPAETGSFADPPSRMKGAKAKAGASKASGVEADENDTQGASSSSSASGMTTALATVPEGNHEIVVTAKPMLSSLGLVGPPRGETERPRKVGIDHENRRYKALGPLVQPDGWEEDELQAEEELQERVAELQEQGLEVAANLTKEQLWRVQRWSDRALDLTDYEDQALDLPHIAAQPSLELKTHPAIRMCLPPSEKLLDTKTSMPAALPEEGHPTKLVYRQLRNDQKHFGVYANPSERDSGCRPLKDRQRKMDRKLWDHTHNLQKRRKESGCAAFSWVPGKEMLLRDGHPRGYCCMTKQFADYEGKRWPCNDSRLPLAFIIHKDGSRMDNPVFQAQIRQLNLQDLEWDSESNSRTVDDFHWLVELKLTVREYEELFDGAEDGKKENEGRKGRSCSAPAIGGGQQVKEPELVSNRSNQNATSAEEAKKKNLLEREMANIHAFETDFAIAKALHSSALQDINNASNEKNLFAKHLLTTLPGVGQILNERLRHHLLAYCFTNSNRDKEMVNHAQLFHEEMRVKNKKEEKFPDDVTFVGGEDDDDPENIPPFQEFGDILRCEEGPELEAARAIYTLWRNRRIDGIYGTDESSAALRAKGGILTEVQQVFAAAGLRWTFFEEHSALVKKAKANSAAMGKKPRGIGKRLEAAEEAAYNTKKAGGIPRAVSLLSGPSRPAEVSFVDACPVPAPPDLTLMPKGAQQKAEKEALLRAAARERGEWVAPTLDELSFMDAHTRTAATDEEPDDSWKDKAYKSVYIDISPFVGEWYAKRALKHEEKKQEKVETDVGALFQQKVDSLLKQKKASCATATHRIERMCRRVGLLLPLDYGEFAQRVEGNVGQMLETMAQTMLERGAAQSLALPTENEKDLQQREQHDNENAEMNDPNDSMNREPNSACYADRALKALSHFEWGRTRRRDCTSKSEKDDVEEKLLKELLAMGINPDEKAKVDGEQDTSSGKTAEAAGAEDKKDDEHQNTGKTTTTSAEDNERTTTSEQHTKNTSPEDPNNDNDMNIDFDAAEPPPVNKNDQPLLELGGQLIWDALLAKEDLGCAIKGIQKTKDRGWWNRNVHYLLENEKAREGRQAEVVEYANKRREELLKLKAEREEKGLVIMPRRRIRRKRKNAHKRAQVAIRKVERAVAKQQKDGDKERQTLKNHAQRFLQFRRKRLNQIKQIKKIEEQKLALKDVEDKQQAIKDGVLVEPEKNQSALAVRDVAVEDKKEVAPDKDVVEVVENNKEAADSSGGGGEGTGALTLVKSDNSSTELLASTEVPKLPELSLLGRVTNGLIDSDRQMASIIEKRNKDKNRRIPTDPKKRDPVLALEDDAVRTLYGTELAPLGMSKRGYDAALRHLVPAKMEEEKEEQETSQELVEHQDFKEQWHQRVAPLVSKIQSGARDRMRLHYPEDVERLRLSRLGFKMPPNKSSLLRTEDGLLIEQGLSRPFDPIENTRDIMGDFNLFKADERRVDIAAPLSNIHSVRWRQSKMNPGPIQLVTAWATQQRLRFLASGKQADPQLEEAEKQFRIANRLGLKHAYASTFVEPQTMSMMLEDAPRTTESAPATTSSASGEKQSESQELDKKSEEQLVTMDKTNKISDEPVVDNDGDEDDDERPGSGPDGTVTKYKRGRRRPKYVPPPIKDKSLRGRPLLLQRSVQTLMPTLYRPKKRILGLGGTRNLMEDQYGHARRIGKKKNEKQLTEKQIVKVQKKEKKELKMMLKREPAAKEALALKDRVGFTTLHKMPRGCFFHIAAEPKDCGGPQSKEKGAIDVIPYRRPDQENRYMIRRIRGKKVKTAYTRAQKALHYQVKKAKLDQLRQGTLALGNRQDDPLALENRDTTALGPKALEDKLALADKAKQLALLDKSDKAALATGEHKKPSSATSSHNLALLPLGSASSSSSSAGGDNTSLVPVGATSPTSAASKDSEGSSGDDKENDELTLRPALGANVLMTQKQRNRKKKQMQDLLHTLHPTGLGRRVGRVNGTKKLRSVDPDFDTLSLVCFDGVPRDEDGAIIERFDLFVPQCLTRLRYLLNVALWLKVECLRLEQMRKEASFDQEQRIKRRAKNKEVEKTRKKMQEEERSEHLYQTALWNVMTMRMEGEGVVGENKISLDCAPPELVGETRLTNKALDRACEISEDSLHTMIPSLDIDTSFANRVRNRREFALDREKWIEKRTELDPFLEQRMETMADPEKVKHATTPRVPYKPHSATAAKHKAYMDRKRENQALERAKAEAEAAEKAKAEGRMDLIDELAGSESSASDTGGPAKKKQKVDHEVKKEQDASSSTTPSAKKKGKGKASSSSGKEAEKVLAGASMSAQKHGLKVKFAVNNKDAAGSQDDDNGDVDGDDDEGEGGKKKKNKKDSGKDEADGKKRTKNKRSFIAPTAQLRAHDFLPGVRKRPSVDEITPHPEIPFFTIAEIAEEEKENQNKKPAAKAKAGAVKKEPGSSAPSSSANSTPMKVSASSPSDSEDGTNKNKSSVSSTTAAMKKAATARAKAKVTTAKQEPQDSDAGQVSSAARSTTNNSTGKKEEPPKSILKVKQEPGADEKVDYFQEDFDPETGEVKQQLPPHLLRSRKEVLTKLLKPRAPLSQRVEFVGEYNSSFVPGESKPGGVRKVSRGWWHSAKNRTRLREWRRNVITGDRWRRSSDEESAYEEAVLNSKGISLGFAVNGDCLEPMPDPDHGTVPQNRPKRKKKLKHERRAKRKILLDVLARKITVAKAKDRYRCWRAALERRRKRPCYLPVEPPSDSEQEGGGKAAIEAAKCEARLRVLRVLKRKQNSKMSEEKRAKIVAKRAEKIEEMEMRLKGHLEAIPKKNEDVYQRIEEARTRRELGYEPEDVPEVKRRGRKRSTVLTAVGNAMIPGGIPLDAVPKNKRGRSAAVKAKALAKAAADRAAKAAAAAARGEPAPASSARASASPSPEESCASSPDEKPKAKAKAKAKGKADAKAAAKGSSSKDKDASQGDNDEDEEETKVLIYKWRHPKLAELDGRHHTEIDDATQLPQHTVITNDNVHGRRRFGKRYGKPIHRNLNDPVDWMDVHLPFSYRNRRVPLVRRRMETLLMEEDADYNDYMDDEVKLFNALKKKIEKDRAAAEADKEKEKGGKEQSSQSNGEDVTMEDAEKRSGDANTSTTTNKTDDGSKVVIKEKERLDTSTALKQGNPLFGWIDDGLDMSYPSALPDTVKTAEEASARLLMKHCPTKLLHEKRTTSRSTSTTAGTTPSTTSAEGTSACSGGSDNINSLAFMESKVLALNNEVDRLRRISDLDKRVDEVQKLVDDKWNDPFFETFLSRRDKYLDGCDGPLGFLRFAVGHELTLAMRFKRTRVPPLRFGRGARRFRGWNEDINGDGPLIKGKRRGWRPKAPIPGRGFDGEHEALVSVELMQEMAEKKQAAKERKAANAAARMKAIMEEREKEEAALREMLERQEKFPYKYKNPQQAKGGAQAAYYQNAYYANKGYPGGTPGASSASSGGKGGKGGK
ncbi:unnamed protein product [Amoebophrya sp. A25]|nr:unnamed protein product [Amoebophrya sp. A25]|eukprot:GSA25T00003314001.1